MEENLPPVPVQGEQYGRVFVPHPKLIGAPSDGNSDPSTLGVPDCFAAVVRSFWVCGEFGLLVL